MNHAKENLYMIHRHLAETTENQQLHRNRAAMLYKDLLNEVCHPSFVLQKLRWIRGLTHNGNEYIYKPTGERYTTNATLLEVQQWALRAASAKHHSCRGRRHSWGKAS